MSDPDFDDGERIIAQLNRRSRQLEAMAVGLQCYLNETLDELLAISQTKSEIASLLDGLR